MRNELWEYIRHDFYTKWINILRPPQFIFELNENYYNVIISDDKNRPEKNFIIMTTNLTTNNLSYSFIDKYKKLIKKGELKL